VSDTDRYQDGAVGINIPNNRAVDELERWMGRKLQSKSIGADQAVVGHSVSVTGAAEACQLKLELIEIDQQGFNRHDRHGHLRNKSCFKRKLVPATNSSELGCLISLVALTSLE
jgi:hypothetical protein